MGSARVCAPGRMGQEAADRKIRTYVWPRGWRAETGPLLEDHKGRACCTPKAHASRHDSLGACDFAGTACTRQSLVFAMPFANTNTCNWIYRFPANPGNAEGRRPAAHPGLGPWLGARVASPRCPILRPGDLSVAGNTLIGQFPSPRSGPDAWQRSSPASVSSWTCWHPRPAQVTLPTSRCKLTVCRDCRPCRGHKATAGIAPRQSPSSRRWGPSVIQGKTRSTTFFLQQIIDRKILPDQGQAATQGVRGLLGRESFQTAVADAIVLAEVTVDGLQTVVGLRATRCGSLPSA